MEKTHSLNFKELTDNLKIGVYRSSAGPQGKFIYANPALCEILGYDAKKILKIKVAEIYETPRQRQVFIKKISRQGFLNGEEVRFKRKDGSQVWCSITAVVHKNKKSKALWIDGFMEDVTAQHQVQRELLESKELFRVVFDNSAVAITVTDKSEKIIAWNPFAERLLGMGKGELFNKPVKELYPPAEWRRMRAFRIRKKGMLTDRETKIIRKDGSIIDVNVSISILRDIEGNITGAIGIVRDITGQKIAERKLKESEYKTRIILDNSAAAITMTDEKEHIISWNRFTEQLLGMKREDLYFKPVSFLYPKDEWLKIRSENIRNIGSRHHLETKVICKNGRIIDIDLSINVLKDVNGNIIGSVGIMQDITEVKKAQKVLLEAKNAAEEASVAKSMFLANMSHEVRTPMNAIVGMIDLTLDTPLNEEQKDNLRTAKDAAGNLLELINDILDLSKVEAGKIKLEAIAFNLRNVLHSTCKGLTVLASNKGLPLTWDVDSQCPEFLIGDPTRIRQIIINLVNNAIKFTDKGKVEVHVRVESASEDECQLKFSVADTGVGIPPDKCESIFENFTQADDSTTRRYGGTGLGLAISKRLVGMMGGRIWVDSQPQKGSTFYFTASFKISKIDSSSSQAAQIAQKDPFVQAVKIDLQGTRILLVEDNLVNQKIAFKILEKKGCQVQMANNGREAIDRMNKETFDIVLMDVQMPVLDGFEATRLIREEEKKTGRHMPIVAMTAHAMEGDEKKCLGAGMDGYISKPIDPLRVYETIQNLLPQRTP